MRIVAHHVTRRGAHVSTYMDIRALPMHLKALHRRRVQCVAREDVREGRTVGGVERGHEGWTWWCEEAD